jgi:hypothetical protein
VLRGFRHELVPEIGVQAGYTKRRRGAIPRQSRVLAAAIRNFPMRYQEIPDTEPVGKQGYSHPIYGYFVRKSAPAGRRCLHSTRNLISNERQPYPKEAHHLRFVIPAKAGIQEIFRRPFWIPAFAGMTS